MEILLNNKRNIKSINVDSFNKIELNNSISPIMEYDRKNMLSASEIFDIEREENAIYRIYGKIEYLSMLNYLKNYNPIFSDLFYPTKTGYSYNTLINTFDFYLVRPYIYTKFNNDNIKYVRNFQVIATPYDFEIYNAAYSTNIFNEQIFAFNFNKSFNVSELYDEFNFPVTELFLYVRYKPKIISFNSLTNISESLHRIDWNFNTGNHNNPSEVANSTTGQLSFGDLVYGDVIEYGKTEFIISEFENQIYSITTPIANTFGTKYNLKFNYKPFIPLKLRCFSNELYKENINSSIYDVVNSIPSYATPLDNNGNYVWRRILPQGYFDPVTNEGVDYPFINKKRYLYENIILDVVPDMSDSTTNSFFYNIVYPESIIDNSIPLNDLNTFNKPC